MVGSRRTAALLLACLLAVAACSDDEGSAGSSIATTGRTGGRRPTGPPGPVTTSVNGEPARTGDYGEVASGEDGGLRWTLSWAPASGGGTCWRVTTEPGIDLQAPSNETCLLPLPGDPPRHFVIEFPFAAGVAGDHDLVVGFVPERVATAEFGFTDGSAAPPTYLDRDEGVVVWAGASRPVAAAVTITMPDGYAVGCGPGDVTAAAELYDLPAAQLIEARKFAWSCLEN